MPAARVYADPRARPSEDVLTDLDRCVLLTVLYADLFDYALSEAELFERLLVRPARREAMECAVGRLAGRYLAVTEGYVTWTGREHLAVLRRRRAGAAVPAWRAARRYAGWLARVPFVRMVAVSGSLAVDNVGEGSDVDLFCLTAPGRLWVARLCIVPLSKMTRVFARRFPHYLCPNYVLALDALAVDARDVFTAHEVVQAVPLWGRACFDAFHAANAWAADYLPQRRVPSCRPAEPPRGAVVRGVEHLLRGRAGDVLDGLVHRAFVSFYRRRAQQRGWPWAPLAQAYQRSRYTVPEGGYVHVVHGLFRQRVRERLGDDVLASLQRHPELGRLFTPAGAAPGPAPGAGCYDWAGLFRQEYGAAAPAAGPIPANVPTTDGHA